MTTYCCETLASAQPELEELLPFHWAEIARDRTNPKFKLKPDWDSYHALEAAGQFFMMVVRVDGKMVGYHLGFVRKQLHYVDSLALISDIFYLLPEYRRGRVGIELFKESEKAAKARGVNKIYLGSKCAPDMDRTKIFEHLGYTKIEYVFAKVLED